MPVCYRPARFACFAAPPDDRRRACVRVALDRFPALVRFELGRSLLGRPIDAYRVGDGPCRAVFVGGHHAAEWLTALVLYCFLFDVGRASERRENGTPGDPVCRETGSFFVIPLLNPDGTEIFLHGASAAGPLSDRVARIAGETGLRAWQANARGVDLNHNYAAGFDDYLPLARANGQDVPGPTRYPGPYPESEPETAALAGFLRAVRPALLVTLHTQGEVIYYHPTDPPVARAAEIGQLLARLCGYRLAVPAGCAAYGGLSDWAAEELRIPAYTFECGLGRNPLSLSAGAGIYRRLRRTLYFATILMQGEKNDGSCQW